MVWDATAQRVAINVIGTVESNLTYDAINYNDAITVGFAQWYGTRAAGLLNQLRETSAWVGVTDRLNNALENNAANSASFWTNFYLQRADGQSLSGPLTSTAGVQIQNAQFLVDIESYNTPAANRGLNRETHTPEFIYYAQLYHQSPRYANQVLTQAGANPTLERLHSLAGNHSWYSQFRSRLNTAKRIIDEWDDELPDQFDPSEPEEGGDQSTDNPITETAGIVDSVQLVGGQLHVRTRSGVVVCEPTPTGTLWVPNGAVGAGPTIPPPTDPGDEDIPDPVDPPTGAEATAMALRQFLLDRVEWYNYSQTDSKRLSPVQGGATDCSALMYFAYRSVVGPSITTSNFGTWTVAQNERGRNIRSFQGSIVPESLLQVGDLVFYSRDSARVRHVEMYIGNGQLIGWGGNRNATPSGKGPYVKPSYVNYYNTFGSGTVWSSARRHLPDF